MFIIEMFNVDEVIGFLFDRICDEIFIFIETIDLLKLNILQTLCTVLHLQQRVGIPLVFWYIFLTIFVVCLML
jgi:hypothetical protein